MTYTRAVTARLLDNDATTVVAGDPLANAFDITFMDELNGPGSGSLSLSLSEAGSAELVPGRFCQILVAGTARFTFMIEGDPEYLAIQEGEEYDEIMRVQGRGWGAVLDTAIVYPEVALDLNLDAPWRVFSFASPSFPNAGAWAAADELYEYLDGVSYPTTASPYRAPVAPDGLRYPAPIGYPFPTSPNILDPLSPPGPSYVNTYWIWPTGQELAVGYAFFRRTLTIAADGVYNISVTADNYFTLFLEGVPILGEQSLVGIWKYWKETEIFLSAGTYQLAAVVQNPDWSLGVNPGAFIMNVYTLDNQQLPDASILVTDSNWVCDFQTDYWPGWTPGQIIDKVIDEAVARGALSPFDTITFTATTDSNTAAWADAIDGRAQIPAFAAEVGSTVMAMLGKMQEEGYIDWHVQPGALRLDAWAANTVGSTPGVSLQAGVNLVTLERGATTIYANSLLVQWERGYVIVSDAAEIASFGSKVEDIYSSDASSDDEATRIGTNELNQRITSGWPAIVATVEPTSTADCPYEGFTLADTVTIPAKGGGTENVQVLAIHLTTDAEGYAVWRLEMNRRWRSAIRQNYELLREIGGRSGRGYGVVDS